MNTNKQSDENNNLNTEQERLDLAYLEQPASKQALYTAVNYIVAAVTGTVILFALYYASLLTGYLRSAMLPYLSIVDDSAGFLTDLVTALLNLLLFAIIAVLFGFALDINYKSHGRPREVWGKYIKFILPTAFGSCLIYALIRQFIAGGSYRVTGSIPSQILYYVTIIAVVPAANVLLYQVLPSAIIRMLLTLISDTKERAELPLIIVSTLVMTIAMLGITPNHIELYGWGIFAFTLIQSASCSLLYLRTNVIRYTILLYSSVSALYLGLAALMNSF